VKRKQIDRIPPTKATLKEHVKRTMYQAGHIWGQTLTAEQQLPNPGDWGWTKNANDEWAPFWMTLPEAAKFCKELLKCSCMKACRPPGKCLTACLTASLQCTEHCNCAGTCFHAERQC